MHQDFQAWTPVMGPSFSVFVELGHDACMVFSLTGLDVVVIQAVAKMLANFEGIQ